jgi:predicted Zn-dependent protease
MIAAALPGAFIAVVLAVAQDPHLTAMETVAQLRTAAEAAPHTPGVWYALGQAYNAVKQDALATFGSPSDTPWRALLSADALLENDHLAEAFALYRAAAESLPDMAQIHDSIARIYDRSGHPDWAAAERKRIQVSAEECTRRLAMCEFRAGRHQSSLEAAMKGSDSESRYWRARAANELALAAFRHLDALPDSPERRSVRATVALAQERYTDAVVDLKAAVNLAPRQPELQFQLASAYYSARDYEAAIATVQRLLESYPNDPRLLNLKAQSLLELQRPDEAIPLLKTLVDRTSGDPRTKLALGRAYFQNRDYKAAIPLLEEQLERDADGSLHVQLARAYSGIGERDKAAPLLTRSEALRKADEERRAAESQRIITGPK